MRTLYLKQPQKTKVLNILLGIIFIVQGVLNLVEPKNNFSIVLGIIQLVLGLVYAIFTYISIKPNSSFTTRISLGEEFIQFKRDFFSKTRTIHLEDIKLMQLKPEQLTLMTKEFDFAYSVNYEASNKQEIMDELAEYAQSNNIPVERIKYRNV